MRPSFFIFSLPRSGSSWLSVFLTGPDSYCYHEPTADYSPSEWLDVAKQRPETHVGAVDTGAYCFSPDTWDFKTKYFSLCRDPHEINRSTRWLKIERYDAFHERMRLDSLKHEHIHYSKLNDIGYLEEIWGRIIGTRFDSERAKQLMEMRIERDIHMFFTSHAQIERRLDS